MGYCYWLSFIPQTTIQFLKIILDYDVIVTLKTPYDTHPKKVINRAEFDVSTQSSFGRVKTDRIALYILIMETMLLHHNHTVLNSKLKLHNKT